MMENLEAEELNQILDRVNGWIENCDSKVSTILSGMGVFAGIFLASDYVSKFASFFQAAHNNISVANVAYLSVSYFALGLLGYGTYLLISVLFARINPAEFKGRAVKSDSLLFFASIAGNKKYSNYRTKIKECLKEQLNEEIISQIYICSLICDKKFKRYKKGLLCSIVGFIVFAIMMIVGVLTF